MALPQKDVFYALLRNHNTQAKELCEQAGVSHRMLAKRLSNGTLYKMGYLDTTRLCVALGVSQTDLIELLEKTEVGGFDDDYPLQNIRLPVTLRKRQ